MSRREETEHVIEQVKRGIEDEIREEHEKARRERGGTLDCPDFREIPPEGDQDEDDEHEAAHQMIDELVDAVFEEDKDDDEHQPMRWFRREIEILLAQFSRKLQHRRVSRVNPQQAALCSAFLTEARG